MSTRAILRALIIFAVLGRPALAQSTAGDSIRRVALRVMQLETSRQLATATPATIDSLLSFYSDSVVYEHPNAGAVIRGKAALRRGMIEYIGSVRSVRADAPNVTVGPRVAVVETNARMEILDQGKWVPLTRHGLRVIELDARGLVRRLIDYPW